MARKSLSRDYAIGFDRKNLNDVLARNLNDVLARNLNDVLARNLRRFITHLM